MKIIDFTKSNNLSINYLTMINYKEKSATLTGSAIQNNPCKCKSTKSTHKGTNFLGILQESHMISIDY